MERRPPRSRSRRRAHAGSSRSGRPDPARRRGTRPARARAGVAASSAASSAPTAQPAAGARCPRGCPRPPTRRSAARSPASASSRSTRSSHTPPVSRPPRRRQRRAPRRGGRTPGGRRRSDPAPRAPDRAPAPSDARPAHWPTSRAVAAPATTTACAMAAGLRTAADRSPPPRGAGRRCRPAASRRVLGVNIDAGVAYLAVVDTPDRVRLDAPDRLAPAGDSGAARRARRLRAAGRPPAARARGRRRRHRPPDALRQLALRRRVRPGVARDVLHAGGEPPVAALRVGRPAARGERARRARRTPEREPGDAAWASNAGRAGPSGPRRSLVALAIASEAGVHT